MILRLINHDYLYEMQKLCQMFFPNEKIVILHDQSGDADIVVTTQIATKNDNIHLTSCIQIEGESICSHEQCKKDDDAEYFLALTLFDVLTKSTGYIPDWGILTGVRPSKLMNTLIGEMGQSNAQKYFSDNLKVKPDKTKLAFDVAMNERKIMELSRPESFSLYVSIPFCPTRCNYCSFVSHSVEHAKKLINPYVENLCREIEITAKYARQLNLRLESIYFGGGTPTTLGADLLKKICDTIKNSFNLSTLREYTIEAGRPDTVTKEKLDVIKKAGVDRISINPQTFNDEVLEKIGRNHTSEKTLWAFESAKEMDFDVINMDLIAGLTGDSFESFCDTLKKTISLDPENITLHTLSLKRSSDLVVNSTDFADAQLVSQMVNFAQVALEGAGYIPYYMYRQSRCLGNLENVGWCKRGNECLYNIFMMEECHTVLAVGAGAVTKLRDPKSNNIERIFNFKYPYEYNDKFEELMSRKEKIREFYNE